MCKMIKAIIFDMGGVFVRVSNYDSYYAYEQISNVFGLDKDYIKQEVRKDLYKLEIGKINTSEFWKNVSKKLNKKFDSKIVKDLFYNAAKNYTIINGMKELVL